MKLAIVGAEERTRGLAPWDDPEYDIWVLNEYATAEWCKRCTSVLQLHPAYVYTSPNNEKDPLHWDWLQSTDIPVYMQEVDQRVPSSIKYPLDEINKEFLSTLTYDGVSVKNFDASICYAVALALYLEYDSIDIYGVELVYDLHYRKQQTNFSFWVGVATGRKVPVDMHCSRGLFDHSLYAYEGGFVEPKSKLEGYLDGLVSQMEEEKKKLFMVEGAIQIIKQLLEEEQKECQSEKEELTD